jgi:hypothetical protein
MPRPEEIAALIPAQTPAGGILAPIGLVGETPTNAAFAEWNAALIAHLDAPEPRDDEEGDARCAAFRKVTHRAWRACYPPKTWDDIVMLAAICVHWNCEDEEVFPGEVSWSTDPSEAESGLDAYSLGFLMKGILYASRCLLEPDGRVYGRAVIDDETPAPSPFAQEDRTNG